MPADLRRYVVWMTVFFAAMAFLESAVVVYLRALYYPEGFDFPLVPMDDDQVGSVILASAADAAMDHLFGESCHLRDLDGCHRAVLLEGAKDGVSCCCWCSHIS